MKRLVATTLILMAAAAPAGAAIREQVDGPAQQPPPPAPRLRVDPGAVAEETRVIIGVHIAPVGEALAAQLGIEPHGGVLIADVIKDLPAERAGLKQYDVITAVDGKPVAGSAGLSEALKGKRPGESVSLMLLRGGKELELTLDVAADERANLEHAEQVATLARERVEMDRQRLQAKAAELAGQAQSLQAKIQHKVQERLKDKAQQLEQERQELLERSLALSMDRLEKARAELDVRMSRLQAEFAAQLAHAETQLGEASQEQVEALKSALEEANAAYVKALQAARGQLELPRMSVITGQDGRFRVFVEPPAAPVAPEAPRALIPPRIAQVPAQRQTEERLARIEQRLARMEEMLGKLLHEPRESD